MIRHMGRWPLLNYSRVIVALVCMLWLTACGYYFKTILDDDYNLPPSSRTIAPVAVLRTSGAVTADGGTATLNGKGSYVVFDFGKEVGGIPSLHFGDASGNAETLFLAFSESLIYTGPQSDQSSGGRSQDGTLSVPVTAQGTYTVPTEKLRGGFRYLTVGLQTGGSAELTGVTLQFTPSPAAADLRAYSGAFQSNDDLLNRIWQAGAYTVQLNTIEPNQGRVWPPPASSWFNNGVSGSGTTILVDGAKRDRLIWPADLGISALTAFVSTGDTLSVKNDLNPLFARQNSAGGLPYVGPQANFGVISDTYHLWTLDVVVDYYLYSGDSSWVTAHWPQIKQAIAFSTAKIGTLGLLSVNLKYDWGRQVPGGEEISANALLFQVLQGMSFLASIAGDTTAQSLFSDTAASVRSAINLYLWDPGAGMYVDVPGSSLHPQDGNSLALWFGIPDSTAKSTAISTALKQRWSGFGALTPERANEIANFPGSMEVLAHFAADDDVTALSLIRKQWGYMLSNPYGTGGTFWEEFLRDGEFTEGSYTSLAHGWATGPTSGLANYVGGIGPELSSTTLFHVIPHPGDLAQASATVALPQGTISASWQYLQSGSSFVETVTAPANVAGRYGIPTGGKAMTVSIDGRQAWTTRRTGEAVPAGLNLGTVSQDSAYVYLSSVPGNHTVMATAGCAP